MAEIKLSSNKQCKHGYEVQVKEYGKAERTRNLVCVLVDVGNPAVVAGIQSLHDHNKRSGIPCPELVIVDAKPRKAASAYIEKVNILVDQLSGAEVASQIEGINFDVLEANPSRLDGFGFHDLIDDVQDQIFDD